MTPWLTPDGVTCPIRNGMRCEIVFRDGSTFAGTFEPGVMTGRTGFAQGTTGWMGGKTRSSWDWRGRGECIPVARYRVWRESALDVVLRAVGEAVDA